MSPTIPVLFTHRFHSDGVDSICPQCFVTIATVQEEMDLEPFEQEHVCDPFLVAKFKFFNEHAA